MSENVIFCYSGTGNCLDMAKNIARELGDTDIVMMRSAPAVTDVRTAKRVGFIFPCYAGGLPGDVEKYVRQIQVGPMAYTFGVCQYAGYMGAGLHQLDGIIRLNYWRAVSHQCSCIWLFPHHMMLPPMPAKQAQKRSEKKAREIAAAVLAGERAAADETVARLYPGLFGDGGARLVASIPSGERHKNVGTVSSLWSAFAAAGLGRRDRVAAVGGGVTGDLTGFAAATWMRGMDWINVPTTLLAMVDASTGGKTGCDLPEGKNLAGAFHFPRLVVVDADFLSTLPEELLAAGRAEMIKHEVIAGVRAGEGTAKGAVPTAAEIAANLLVKVGIVKEDPFERTGLRMKLNCGHTVGHAVEKLSGYALAHGAAVAIGCVEEARIAAARALAPAGWPAELAARFAAAGLPTEIPPEIDRARIDETMKGDKKRAGDVIAFALPCGWGNVRIEKIDLGKEPLFRRKYLPDYATQRVLRWLLEGGV